MGASDSVDKIYNILSQEDFDTKFIKYAEDEIEKLAQMVENIDRDIDGIFLTGIAVYSELSSKIKFDKPVVYTQRGMIGIIKALYEFAKDFENTIDTRIALDIINEKDLLEVLKEFDIKVKSYDIQKYMPNKNEKDYITYYENRYENHEIDCIFTSFGFIYRYFKKLDIPVYRIQATNIDIKNRYNELKDIIKLNKINERTIQVQVIDLVDVPSKFLNDKYLGNRLEKEILAYSKETEGIMSRSDGKYIIFSNKGVLLSNGNVSSLYKLIESYKEHGIILGAGIGEGETIFKSEINAKNALRKSALEKKGNIYFYDGENVIGPLMKEKQIKYKSMPDKKALQLSKEIGISYHYIIKINSIIEKLGRNEFTSQEFSEFFHISERSANRILKKIVDSNYGVESNLEPSLGAGRPRRQVKIFLN